MNKITITVVVPVYNVDRYINSSLGSILEQSRQPDEVIIVDDGSDDKTPEILRKYAFIPNWKTVRTENFGLGPARNLGRELATGEYVYFFDSDDLLVENFVEEIEKRILENDHPDLILFAGDPFYDDESFRPPVLSYKRTLTGIFSQKDNLLTALQQQKELYASACLYISKRDLWRRNGLTFPPVIHEDEAVVFPLLAVSKKVLVLPDIFFLRRVRRGSIMTTAKNKKNVEGLLVSITETLSFMMRKPDLVKNDSSAWKIRLKVLINRYVRQSKSIGMRPSIVPILAAIAVSKGRSGLRYFSDQSNF